MVGTAAVAPFTRHSQLAAAESRAATSSADSRHPRAPQFSLACVSVRRRGGRVYIDYS